MKHLCLMQGPLILINHIPGSDIQSLLRPGYVQSCAAERVPFVAFKSLPPWVLQPNAIICLLSSEMGVFVSASSDFYLPGFLFIIMGLFFSLTRGYSMSGHVSAFYMIIFQFLGHASWCVSICFKHVANYVCS